MERLYLYSILLLLLLAPWTFYITYKYSRLALGLNSAIIFLLLIWMLLVKPTLGMALQISLYLGCPLFLINLLLYVFVHRPEDPSTAGSKYQVNFKVKQGSFKIKNIRRGASVIGAAGSGKTESVVLIF